MRRKKQYRVLCQESARDLQKQVNNHLAFDYELYEGPFLKAELVNTRYDQDNQEVYETVYDTCQAVVKRETWVEYAKRKLTKNHKKGAKA